MGTASTPDVLRGLLVPISKSGINGLDLENSTATQSDPEPDQPTHDGYMQLESYGTADGETIYTVTCRKPGQASGGTRAGRHTWKDEADAAGDEKGWMALNKPQDFRHILHHNESPWSYATFAGYRYPRCIRQPDHQLIMVYDDQENQEVRCVTRGANDADFGSPVTVFSKGADWYAFPDVVEVDEGRLLCFYLRKDLTEGANTYYTVGMSYSENNGSTWVEGVAHMDGVAIDTATSATPRKLRVVFHGGAYLTFFMTFDATDAYHYVSDDLGASATEINAGAEPGHETTGSDAAWDIVALRDGSVALFTRTNAGGTTLQQYVKASPRQPFADDPNAGSAGFGSVNQQAAAGATVSVCMGDDGFIWGLWTDDTTDSEVHMLKIDPETMSSAIADDELVYSGVAASNKGANEPMDLGADVNTRLVDHCLVPYRGGYRVYTNNGGQGSVNASLSEIVLGGWSNVDWKVQSYGIHEAAGVVRSGMLYIPIESPATIAGWTVSTSGTPPTPSITSDGLQLNASTGSWVMYRVNTGTGEPAIGHIVQKMTSSASLGQDDCALFLRRGDNTVQYSVSLRISDTSARLFDNNAGSAVGSDITGLTSGQFHAFLVILEEDRAICYYKDDPASLEWETGPSGALTDGGAGAYNRVEYGHRVNASGTFTGNSILRFFGSAIDDIESPTGHPSTGYSHPEDLVGRPYSVYQQWLDRGVRYASNGSSAYISDAHIIATRYERGLVHLCADRSPSPANVWQAQGDGQVGSPAADQRIVWDFGAITRMPSSSVGWLLLGANFGQVIWEYSDDATTWTSVGTFNLHTEFNGVDFTRTGDRLIPANSGSTSGSRYIRRNELAGGYVVFDPFGSAVMRPIRSNAEGAWEYPPTRPPEIVIDGSLAGLPTTGNIAIIPPRALLIAHNVTSTYRYWSLRMVNGAGVNVTYEDAYKCGVMFPGWLAIFGLDNSWGRSVTSEMLVDDTEAGDGTRITRKRGDTRRVLEVSWVDGWDMTGADTSPDYIRAKDNSAYEGVAVKADATLIEQVFTDAAELEFPIAWCGAIPNASTADTHVVTSREAIVYGWGARTVSRPTILGDEDSTEVVRIDAATITEQR